MVKKKELTAEEYLERFEEVKDMILEAGEVAVQMVNHHPAYFITDKIRIISVMKSKPIELGIWIRYEKKEAKKGSYNKQAVALMVGGERKNYYIHRLVAEYFDIDEYFSENDTSRNEIHHKGGYDTKRPQLSNSPENLLSTTHNIHMIVEDAGKIFADEKRQQDYEKRLAKYLPDTGISLIWHSTNTKSGETACSIEKVTLEQIIQLFRRSQQEADEASFFIAEERDYDESKEA